MNRINSKKTLGNSIIFTGMTVIQKGLGFVLLPIYTIFLSPEEYGIANLVTSVCAIFSLVISLALDDAIARYYVDCKTKNDVKTLTTTIVTVALISSVLILTAIVVFRKILLDPFLNDVDFYPYVILGLVQVGATSVYNIFQKVLIIETRALHYTINTFVFFLLNTAFCILFITKLGMGACGMLLAGAIVYIIFFIYSMIMLIKRMNFKFDKDIAEKCLKYGFVLLPNRIATWGMATLNKVILGNKISVASLGIYNIGITFSGIVNIVSNSVAMALQPFFFYRLSEGKAKDKIDIQNIVQLISMIFCLIGFGIILFSVDIIHLVINENYWSAVQVIPILTLGEIFSAYSTLFIHTLFYFRDLTKYVAVSTFLGAVISIGTSFLLIPHFGIFGCAAAIVVANVVTCIIKAIISNRKIQIKSKRMFGFAFLSYGLGELFYSKRLVFKIILFALVTFLYMFFNKKEIKFFLKELYGNHSKE